MLLCVTHVATAPRAGVGIVRSRRSITINVEDSFGKGPRRFLRQIVPDAARDHPVRIRARELLGISTGVRVRRPIGIPVTNRANTSLTPVRGSADRIAVCPVILSALA
jgi:hypothetical protein